MSRIVPSRTKSCNTYTSISQQLRELREKTGLSQAAVGRLAEMAPERISILEDPESKTKPTITTLLRLAEVFEVDLEVRFVKRGDNQSFKTEHPVKKYQNPWDHLMESQSHIYNQQYAGHEFQR